MSAVDHVERFTGQRPITVRLEQDEDGIHLTVQCEDGPYVFVLDQDTAMSLLQQARVEIGGARR